MKMSLGDRLISASRMYLVVSWVYVAVSLLGDSDELLALALFAIVGLAIVAFSIYALVIASQWMGWVYRAAVEARPGEVTVSKNWAFWGWVTPIASLWMPKKFIDQCQKAFNGAVPEFKVSDTGKWWGFFIASSLLDYVSFKASGSSGPNTLLLIDFVSALCLTMAYQPWVNLVANISETVVRQGQSNR